MFIPRSTAIVPISYDVQYIPSVPTQLVRTYDDSRFRQVLFKIFRILNFSMHDCSYL
jgi:hypothetical protein